MKDAEAGKTAAELHAEEIVIEAEAEETAAEKESSAKKMLAEATSAESAAVGMGEAQVVKAKGDAEAEAITAKADAMKLYDEVGKEHEEFKLELEKEKSIELAEIEAKRDIAAEQAMVLGEAMRTAKIDIVGGDGDFFERITNSITAGKSFDRMIDNSDTLTDIKETFFNGDPEYFRSQIRSWIDQFGISSEDLKNLTVSAVLGQMINASGENGTRAKLETLLSAAKRFGMADEKADVVFKRLTAK